MQAPEYQFLRQAGRILNSGQARTIVLTGAIHDLFHLDDRARSRDNEEPRASARAASRSPGRRKIANNHSESERDSDQPGVGEYVPLLPYLTAHWDLPERILVVYELNGPIRFLHAADREKVRDAWLKLRTGLDASQLAIEQMLHAGKMQAELATMSGEFDAHLQRAIGKPTLALELLRQMCLASRSEINGRPLLREGLIILVEAADFLVPEAEITRLSDADRHRVAICQDWFSDPGFLDGDDAVILLAESRSMLHHRIAQLPHVLEVEVASADEPVRRHFIDWFDARQPSEKKVRFEGSRDALARLTAGLSIHALGQLLKGASHEGQTLTAGHVVAKVEEYIKSQLGEDIVEFKKPKHTLADVVGFGRLKGFLRSELIPRFQSSGPDVLPGAAVAGPIGGGKTFIFEALAAELDIVVLVLKNIRSQWFGQTDVILERLKRVLNALAKVLIFVDEADTQFGRVDAQAHATERRLTGKIQAMMSDPALRGRVIWLLMTARIHLLSPDIRRPGRTGDLIIPVLDPEGEDRDAFLHWVAQPVLDRTLNADELERLSDATPSDAALARESHQSLARESHRSLARDSHRSLVRDSHLAPSKTGVLGRALNADGLERLSAATPGYSAANFASLRSELIAKARGDTLSLDYVIAVAQDLIPAEIGQTRRYQTLQALLNCTRRSLLPDPEVDNAQREAWRREIRQLEQEGIE
ncbi:MAG: ATP-binding protein [Phycisphaerae bacterium]|nr:ATP-binding protein [Phycisphaerae bacterium]